MKAAKAAQRWGLALGLALLFWQGAAATIYNWQTGQPIPGSEGITPQPGVDLSYWNTQSHNLQYGDFRTTHLNLSQFGYSWLDYAHFGGANLTSASLYEATLTGADLSGANLTSANLYGATLAGADVADATVRKADFGNTTSTGFTREQLYSTASWKAKDLTGIWLRSNDLSGWNLAGQNLTSANLYGATLTGADLSGANLNSAHLTGATLTGANLADATIRGASFQDTTSRGFTKEQLYSTASWKTKDLTSIGLLYNDLSGWNLAGQNLTSASLGYSTLTGANLSGANLTSANLSEATLSDANLTDAIVQRADLGYTTSGGFTKQQLYSTASWKAKDLTRIGLADNDLSGWNLAGQNLTSAYLHGATLAGAVLTDAIVQKAVLRRTTSGGFTKAQLYSTASWKAKDLTGIWLGDNDLSGWNLAGQNLTSANLQSATLIGADLSGANLTSANLVSAYLYQATLSGANLADAIVQGAEFGDTTSRGFTKEQLYSTAGWKAKNLDGIGLGFNDLSGWNLAGQILNDAILYQAALTGADLADARVPWADFEFTTSRGFTKEQLYSTASWKAKNLIGIWLGFNDLSGWNLAGQNLTRANLQMATLTGADLSGASLTWATLSGADLALADLRKATGASLTGAVTRNTIRPDGKVEGLNLLAGDTLIVRNCDLGITVQTAMTFDPAAVIEFRLDNGVWGSTLTPATGVVPDLGGTLQLSFAEGVDPALLVGKTFDLFNWADPLDAGNRFDDVRSEPWASWDLGALYTTGEVTLLAVPEPATLSLLALGMLCIASARRRCQPLA
jgi:uncharacterized protein YjbI with pentapeptide repeats